MKFTELSLHPDLQRGIAEAEFTDCTPVQAQTISHVLAGKDVTVQSQTGTGKTAAFLIPIFQLALEADSRGENPGGARALIIAPTRELAVQIHDEALMLGKHLPYKCAAFYGGVGYKAQEDMLAKGVDIIIGTPGRLIDFQRSGKLNFSNIDCLVVDEADRLFDMGFYPDIQTILQKMKSKQQRRTLLFSATMGTRVMNIAWERMNEPVEVVIEPEHITVEAIEQTLFHLSRDEKLPVLLGLFKKINPANAIIFTNTKRMAEELCQRLILNGYSAEFIMGDLPQSKRLKVISSLKKGSLKFLVATDVAARGLHIDDLELVVNYDIPEDPENYVHRIGRTARAGKSGRAISFADERFVYGLPAIEQLIGLKIPVGELSADLFAEDLSAGQRIRLEHGGRDNRGDRSPGGHRTRPERGPRRTNKPASIHPPKDRKHIGSRKEVQNTGARRDTVPKNRKVLTPEERLEYYKKKYGEDFDIKGNAGGQPSQKTKPKKHKKNQNRPNQGKGQAKPVQPQGNIGPGKPAETPKPVKKKGIAGFIARLFGTD